MPKISKRLEEVRNWAILEMFNKQYSAQEIAILFNISVAQTYNIIKDQKLIKEKQ